MNKGWDDGDELYIPLDNNGGMDKDDRYGIL
jgi:hypothetical protein